MSSKTLRKTKAHRIDLREKQTKNINFKSIKGKDKLIEEQKKALWKIRKKLLKVKVDWSWIHEKQTPRPQEEEAIQFWWDETSLRTLFGGQKGQRWNSIG